MINNFGEKTPLEELENTCIIYSNYMDLGEFLASLPLSSLVSEGCSII
jgi:hypothetical protein